MQGKLRKNLVANYLGQAWVAVMNLAFVPLYIKYLGLESYGIIGIFAVLQAWLVLLDIGMTPTLSREMGRFTGGAQTGQSILDLLRSVEWCAAVIASILALAIGLSADWIARYWLKVDNLPIETVAHALTLMGLVAAFRFLENIYKSCLTGLQLQVFFNVVYSVSATFRGLGAVLVLIWISPTIQAFFIWQFLVSVLTMIVLLISTYRFLPHAVRGGQFSVVALRSVAKYAGGMALITFLTLLLTQVDKMLLSNLLSLSDYGVYMLAAVVAGGLYILLAPIVQAWFPRMSHLHAQRESAAFVEAFHQGSQMVSVVMGSAAVVLILYAEAIIRLWTQNADLAAGTVVLVQWLALGNLLNGLMAIPYQAQLAVGWTGYAIGVNSISVALVIPAILLAVPVYGSLGAAVVWVCLNAFYVLVAVHFMYRKILKREKSRWYTEDILRPILAALVTAVSLQLLMPGSDSPLYLLLEILFVSIFTLLAAAISAPRVMLTLRKSPLIPAILRG